MSRYKKIAAAVTGLALTAAVAAPLLSGQIGMAKWLSGHQEKAVIAEAAASQSEPIDKAKAAIDNTAAADKGEAVITNQQGKSVRVIVAGQKTPKTVLVDEKEAKALQEEVNAGRMNWMLKPVEVVRNNAAKYGFDAIADSFTLMNQNAEAGVSRVLVRHGERYYLMTLSQPVGTGNYKIWQIKSISEVRVVEKEQPDVGPGVVGLDYEKIVAWQQNVDEGRELWRLDPMAVALQEGKAYGFTDEDRFTLVKRYDSTSRARHGEIHVKVNHKGKDYTMILVRPLGSDDGAIWTVYSVSGIDKADERPVVNEKVLFETQDYAGWRWNHNQYLKDMAFTTIVDYRSQLEQDGRIPAAVLEKAKDVDYSKNIVLFAFLGTAPSGGYGIGIEKVTLKGNNMTVQIQTRSPRPGQPVTLAITTPSDFVTIDRQIVDIWGGVNISFIDDTGKILSKNKLVISHR